MSERKIYTAGKIFDGDKTSTEKQYIITENGIIQSITSERPEEPITDFGEEATLTPALIDIQIYGAYGKLLCNELNADAVKAIYDYSRSGGAAYAIPCMATNTFETYCKAMDAVRAYIDNGGKGILGIHIEGTWFNPKKKGCHPIELLHKPTLEEAKKLVEHGNGVIRLVTLAPEMATEEVIDYLQSQGIVVSAGHSNATYEEATEKFNHCNIRTSTHMYNAMSSFMHRAPGLVGAILDHHAIRASIIPDGYHVAFPVIRVTKQVMGRRLFVITDAQTESSTGYYHNHLEGDRYVSEGTLSGSALTMGKAVKNLVEHCEISFEEAVRMCSLYPSEVIRIDHKYGKIANGYEAKFAVWNKELIVTETID